MMSPAPRPDGAAELARAARRLRGAPILLDERTGPSVRAVLGAALAGAREADFAIARVRLAAVDLTPHELSRLQRCRVLLGQVDATTFADAGAASATSTAHRAQLDILRRFLESGRAEVRAAGSEAWTPDFSVLRDVRWTPEDESGDVALLGAHYFAKPFPVRGAALTCLTSDPEVVAALRRRFLELWRRGYDVAPVLRDAIEKMLGAGAVYRGAAGAGLVREAVAAPAGEAGERTAGDEPDPGTRRAARENPQREADPRGPPSEVDLPVRPRDAALVALASRFDGQAGQAFAAEPVFDLATFQRDAVRRAETILERRRGVLVADAVGLGKTFVALALIERRLRVGGTVLVAIPAALRRTWAGPLRRLARELGATLQVGAGGDAIPADPDRRRGAIRLVSHTSLSRGAGPVAPLDLVVVDEAHAFRNPGTRRYRSLAGLCRGAEVVLLTATPVNNALSDLYFQLRLFAGDASFRDVGVPDLRGAFEAARGGLAARPVLPVLRDVMVRRTRPFLREHYAGAAWPGGEAVRLPRRAAPRAVRYSMDPAGSGVFGDVASVLASLTLAPYRPAAYGLAAGAGETPAELVRLTLLKRLESSVVAFRASVARQVRFLESFVDALGRGFLLLPGSRGSPRAADGDQLLLEPVALSACPAGAERERLEADARADLAALRGLLGRLRVGAGAADPKLEALRLLLDELAGRKVVVFTEFRETARYLARALERRGAVGLVDGRGALLGGAPAGRREVVERFAPAANGAPEPPARERVELLIATDVLSEGLNLQDAAHVVSYDLPWNPIRLVQRVGRVDRLGSPHGTVYPYHFVPERGLEELLGLLRRLRGKLRAIEDAVPGDDAVLDGSGSGGSTGALERLLAGDGAVLDDLERVDAAPFEAEERLRGLAARVLSQPALERLRRHAGGACRAAVLDPAAGRELVLVAGERRGRGVWLVYDPATGLVEEDDLAAAEVIAAALRPDAVAGAPDGGRATAAERAAAAAPADGLLRAGETLAGAERAPRPGAASVAARRLLRGLGRERGRADPLLCGRVDRLLAALSRLGEVGDAGTQEAVRRVVRTARSGAAGALAELVEALETALRSGGERAVRAEAAGGDGGPFEVRATIELRRGSGGDPAPSGVDRSPFFR